MSEVKTLGKRKREETDNDDVADQEEEDERRDPVCLAQLSPGVFCGQPIRTAVKGIDSGMLECVKCHAQVGTPIAPQNVITLRDVTGRIVVATTGKTVMLNDDVATADGDMGFGTRMMGSDGEEEDYSGLHRRDSAASDASGGSMDDAQPLRLSLAAPKDESMSVAAAASPLAAADKQAANAFSGYVNNLGLPPAITRKCVQLWSDLRSKYGFERIHDPTVMQVAVLELVCKQNGTPRTRQELCEVPMIQPTLLTVAHKRLRDASVPVTYDRLAVMRGFVELYVSRATKHTVSAKDDSPEAKFINAACHWCAKYVEAFEDGKTASSVIVDEEDDNDADGEDKKGHKENLKQEVTIAAACMIAAYLTDADLKRRFHQEFSLARLHQLVKLNTRSIRRCLNDLASRYKEIPPYERAMVKPGAGATTAAGASQTAASAMDLESDRPVVYPSFGGMF